MRPRRANVGRRHARRTTSFRAPARSARGPQSPSSSQAPMSHAPPDNHTAGRERAHCGLCAERAQNADCGEHRQRQFGPRRHHQNRLQEHADRRRFIFDEIRRRLGRRKCQIGSFHRDAGTRGDSPASAACPRSGSDKDDGGADRKLAEPPLGSAPSAARSGKLYLRRPGRTHDPPVAPPSRFASEPHLSSRPRRVAVGRLAVRHRDVSRPG